MIETSHAACKLRTPRVSQSDTGSCEAKLDAKLDAKPHATMKTAPTLAAPQARSQRAARILLSAAALTTAYLGFFAYKAHGFDATTALDDRLLGHASAPDQYRIGVYALAHWLCAHLHIVPSMAFAALDLVSCLFALLVLFHVFTTTATHADETSADAWLGALSFVLAAVWFLTWLLWLQKPETLPAAALLTAMLWCWSSDARPRRPLRALALLLLNLALASFRADLACCFALGFLIAALRREPLALPRAWAIGIAACNTLIALVAQLWLMRVVYPQASYGRVKLWQLWPNLHHATRWPPFLLFLLPLLWMVAHNTRHGWPRDAAGRATALGAAPFAALWCTIGKIDEVRIFLPFAFALMPVLVRSLLAAVHEEDATRSKAA